MTRFIFKRAKLISVRDKSSVKLLKALGVKQAIDLASDAAFAVGYDGSSFHREGKYIVMSVRPWKTLPKNFYFELGRFVDYAYKKFGLNTLFIPFQKLVYDDQKCYERVRNYVKNKKALQIAECNDYTDALELIRRSYFVIGMRLHSIIFSIIARRPFLALSYSKKVHNFLRNCGINSYIKLKDVSFQTMLDKYENVNRKEMTMKLEQVKLNKTYEFFNLEPLLLDLFK